MKKTGCYVTAIELSSIVKAYYSKSSCHCGNCSSHLSFENQEELRILGPYCFSTLRKLRSQGVVEFVVPKDPKMYQDRRRRVLSVDRFFEV